MFQLKKLKYKYDALEPHIDAKTMEIHHSKHHQAYVDKLNGVLKGKKEWEKMKLEELLANLRELPESMYMGVRNNGGGVWNHNMFFELLTPGGGELTGKLKQAINKDFGSLTKFKIEFSEAAMTRFGSGWAWLVMGKDKLEVMSTANQDNPLMLDEGCGCDDCECGRGEKMVPIIGLDVWEHAYYLKYQNKRQEYVDSFWKVLNWKKADESFAVAVK